MNMKELQSIKVPFKVYNKKSQETGTVIGYTKNDLFGIGGGLLPDIPCVHFKGGQWITINNLLVLYELRNGKVIEARKSKMGHPFF